MEVIAIGLICTAVFGAVVALAAFLRHILLSRDKQLNDKAQQRALTQEADELKNIRQEMQSRKRMTAHYQLLNENKHAIQHLDDKIDELTQKKAELITRWAEMTIEASRQMIDHGADHQQKSKYDKVKQSIDAALANYDQEISQLQKRREALLTTHQEIGMYLLEQDKKANDNLDGLYEKHSMMLEKMFIRHNENSEHVATRTIDAGTNTFALILKAPIQYLTTFFKSGTGFNLDKLKDEIKSRGDVADMEDALNEAGDSAEDFGDDVEPADQDEAAPEDESQDQASDDEDEDGWDDEDDYIKPKKAVPVQ